MGLRTDACPRSWQLPRLGQAVQVQVSETVEEPAESVTNRRVSRLATSLDWRLDFGVPALIRLGEMLVQLAVLSWLNPAGGPSLSSRLTEWDAVHYGIIAAHWYPSDFVIAPDGSLAQGHELAFYPLYPTLAAFVRFFGFSTTHALLITAAGFGLVASVVVHLLARHVVGSRRAGYIACALLGVLPMAITLQMGYTESLYFALAAGALLASLNERWFLAGALAFAAGLTRPSGLLVPLVIPLAAWSLHRAHRPVPWSRVSAATILGFAGAPTFWLYLYSRTGVLNTWFVVSKHGWGDRFDFGHQTWKFLHDMLQHPKNFDDVMAPATAAIIIGFVVACGIALSTRYPPPIIVLTVLSVAMVVGSTNYWHSKPRLLLAAFPIVVITSGGLSRFRTRTVIIVVATGLLVSAWFGAYTLDVWQYAI